MISFKGGCDFHFITASYIGVWFVTVTLVKKKKYVGVCFVTVTYLIRWEDV